MRVLSRTPAITPARRRVAAGLAVALAASGLVAACSTSSTDSPANEPSGTPTGSASSAVYRQVKNLTIATSFAIDDLDPMENGFWAPEFGYSDLLMQPQPDGTVKPWLLESLKQVDGTRWDLTLRPRTTFQNGHALDAKALAALMTWTLANNESMPATLKGSTAAATGDLTVRLTLKQPVADLPSRLADESVFPLFDLPVYLRDQKDPAKLVADKIYTGPYTVTKLTPDVMSLAPTPGYYGGTPALTGVTVKFVPEAQSRISAVRNGEADIALYPPTTAARELQSSTDAVYVSRPKGSGSSGLLLYVNQRSGPLADENVRKAVRDGIDYKAIADQVFNGLYDTSPGLFPAFVPYSEQLLETDPAAAEQALDAAGWTRTGDGIREKDGKKLSLTTLTYPQQPDSGTIALAVQAQLKAIGVDIRIKQVDDIESSLAEKSGWDLGIDGNGSLGQTSTDPIDPLVSTWLSDADSNYGGVNDSALDATITKLSTTSAGAEQNDLLEQAARSIVDEHAYGWFLGLRRTPVIVGPKVKDYPVPVANLWLSPYS